MVREKGEVYFETGPLDKDQQRETKERFTLKTAQKKPKEYQCVS